MSCQMCGGQTWDGPKYVTYGHPVPAGWPERDDRRPYDRALMFACSTCGYRRFVLTVVDGGQPAAIPQPGQKSGDPEEDE